MAKKQQLRKTEYPGVWYADSILTTRTGKVEKDLSFYVRYSQNGKRKKEYVGRRSEGMSAAQAAIRREQLKAGQKVDRPKSARSGRTKPAPVDQAAAADDYMSKLKNKPLEYWTLDRLWDQYIIYMGGPGGYANYKTDAGRYTNHLQAIVGHMYPADMSAFFINSVRNKLKSKTYTPTGTLDAIAKREERLDRTVQDMKATRDKAKKVRLARTAETIKDDLDDFKKRAAGKTRKLSNKTIESTIEIIRRLINFGIDNKFCKPVEEKVKVNKVDNEKTEDLTPEQIRAFFAACDADENQEAADMLRLALLTGLRRGSIFALVWQHVNFQKDQILIKSIEQQGKHSKGGHQIKIPLNEIAKAILQARAAVADRDHSPYVFPGKNGGKRTCMPKAARRICDRAGIPADFRPFHGQRHSFATNLVNTGSVDLSQIGKLLGQSPHSQNLTKRYAHLRDEALKKASSIMSDIVTDAVKGTGQDTDDEDKTGKEKTG